MPDAVALHSEDRTRKYWKIDGLPLLVPSTISLLWNLWGSRYFDRHHDFIGYFLLLAIFILSLDLKYGSQRSISFLKNRTTWHRAGYKDLPEEDGPSPPDPATWKPLFPEDGRPKWRRYWEWSAWEWLFVLAAVAVVLIALIKLSTLLSPFTFAITVPTWLVPAALIAVGFIIGFGRWNLSYSWVAALGCTTMGIMLLFQPVAFSDAGNFLEIGFSIMGVVAGMSMLVRYLRNNPATE